jgi:hypothetical protein
MSHNVIHRIVNCSVVDDHNNGAVYFFQPLLMPDSISTDVN